MPTRALGFTLMEMMITIAILGIVMAIAAPNMSVWIQQTKLKGVTENLAQDLALAKAEAGRLNKPIRLNLQSGSSSCYGLTSRSSDCNCSITDAGNSSYCEIKRDGGWGNLTLTPASGDFDNLVFDAIRGLPLSSSMAALSGPQDVTLSNPAGSTQVSMNIIGSICIKSAAGSSKIAGYPNAC